MLTMTTWENTRKATAEAQLKKIEVPSSFSFFFTTFFNEKKINQGKNSCKLSFHEMKATIMTLYLPYVIQINLECSVEFLVV